ncbi:RNA-binding protein with multiple splicing 2-like [Chiloscyllium plagiosum]|uniref:RNA-binding protein with multiple splicing 2-like n=1 Tax=Chiloscyllium plagiosum TaxID=36176 RepID=UPI001CB859EB|nr:RNA-binding protein with multiple splicing 2-like [Chiloscyllium plagiosum]
MSLQVKHTFGPLTTPPQPDPTNSISSSVISTKSEEPNNSEEEVGTLFVSGLPMDITPRELYLLFRSFKGYEGSLIKLTSQQPVGFVTFNSRTGAEEAKNAAFTWPAAAVHAQVHWYPPSEVPLEGWKSRQFC